MTKNRLEAFSDGVLAIIITIMVLELKVPHTPDINALQPLIPVLLSYVLSFLYIGIYWNNHHHLLHAAKKVNGGILWANLHLLFWLSLFPFVTGWMGENHFEQTPTLIYGTILLLAAIAYYILQTLIVKTLEKDSLLIKAIGKDIKGKASPILYLTAILLVFVNPLITQFIYVLVALIWLVPDKIIEKIYYDSNHKSQNKIIE